jgi:hypothetical protein
MFNEVMQQIGQFGELRSGREGYGKVLLMGIFCILCIFNSDASLHLSIYYITYLRQI